MTLGRVAWFEAGVGRLGDEHRGGPAETTPQVEGGPDASGRLGWEPPDLPESAAMVGGGHVRPVPDGTRPAPRPVWGH